MRIIVLGSTGSIGTQTLEVADNLNKQGFKIETVGLTGNKNIDLLAAQIIKYQPESAVVMNEESAVRLKNKIKGVNLNRRTKILVGHDGMTELISMDAGLVVNALVGNIGLMPTLTAIRSGKNVALANKEAMVTAGGIINEEVNKYGVKLIPIDSEHSAIMQCLAGNEKNKISRIFLTASGGPFRLRKSLDDITPEQALSHPNWSMGEKITIDSATLMNKGLEVIEAKWLFNLEPCQIKVVVHPQSIIHSMVEFEDGAVMAQLGTADMRIPIQYALTYPLRIKSDYPKLNFLDRNMLGFEEPNTRLFRCLTLAYEAIEINGTMPAVMNAANETAVELFLNNKIKFIEIPELIEKAMLAYKHLIKHKYNVADVLEASSHADEFVRNQF